MAKFENGHKKVGGRVEGAANKNTVLRDKIRDFLNENFEIYAEALRTIVVTNQEVFIREYREMVKYVVPAISPVPYDSDSKITTAQEHLRKMTGYDADTESDEEADMKATARQSYTVLGGARHTGVNTKDEKPAQAAGAPNVTNPTKKTTTKKTKTKISKKNERTETDKPE